MHFSRSLLGRILLVWVGCPGLLLAGVYNLKVVTDASPDYSDMASLIRSTTSRWDTPAEKCWALFYWNHIARRQTTPMELHGLALTDPIRQFNDYGYTMCSTIAGINCSIWDAMGLKTKYWDISNHTVSEVEYDGGWHLYDNSMSAIYTRCDGRTLAAVAEIGQPGACAASGGRTEPGHIARYHCLTATSPRGFLTGADTIRSLDEEYRCFNPNGLKYRAYFYDWDRGHRYILNLRQGESYARHYRSLGKTPEYYVPNRGKDPEKVNERYRIRGNGVREYRPVLEAGRWESGAHSHTNVRAWSQGGLAPEAAGKPAWVIYKIEGANVLTALKIKARFERGTAQDISRIAISTANGLGWQEVWKAAGTGPVVADLTLIEPVNGAYEVLVKVELLAQTDAAQARLEGIEFEALTMLNSKTQPRLLVGRNTVVADAGAPVESIVFWPDLQGERYQPFVVAEKNLATAKTHPGYMGVMHAREPRQEAYAVFRIDAPEPITGATYGGRFYNRAPGSQIDLAHSFDGGQNWIATYVLTNTAQPWDVIHYATISEVPSASRAIWFRYRLRGPEAAVNACSIYAVRMEVNHQPRQPAFAPMAVTFEWSERQADYSLVKRSHTELVTKLPHRYTVNVGGVDHPVMEALRISVPERETGLVSGYADGRDAGGDRFVPQWVTYGRNLARSKPYTVSVPSTTQWDSGDPDGTKLTDGVAGPPYPGGIAPRFALCWNQGATPLITVDLGKIEQCGAFRIQMGAGWPWWDALKGEIKDTVEVLTSTDNQAFTSQGQFQLNLRWRDFPVNHLWPDEEVVAAHLYELALPRPVDARYVQFKVTPRRTLTVSEVEVLDGIRYTPFDLRLALP